MSYELLSKNEDRLRLLYSDHLKNKEQLSLCFKYFSKHFMELYADVLPSYTPGEVSDDNMIYSLIEPNEDDGVLCGLDYSKLSLYLELQNTYTNRIVRLFIDPTDTTSVFIYGYSFYSIKTSKRVSKNTLNNFEVKLQISMCISAPILFCLTDFLLGQIETIPPSFNRATYIRVH